ncbi:hypothetical protein SDC9_169416 [bioreactor metagenome]|uniref:Uncharacterized protein n=1 Tax=bioreactor metagenome TaxID=1076179 RepID=A0A645GDZ3_9ZZZZ
MRANVELGGLFRADTQEGAVERVLIAQQALPVVGEAFRMAKACVPAAQCVLAFVAHKPAA